jgi:hypothetical protein
VAGDTETLCLETRKIISGIVRGPAMTSTRPSPGPQLTANPPNAQGDHEPWTHMLEHEREREILPETDLDDGTLVYR